MNIMNKLTLRMLWKNKRRTLVTIIGVVISVAMLTAVAAISVSFLDLLKRQTIADGGEWHVTYEGVDTDQLEAIDKDDNTKKIVLSDDVGYALFDEENNHTPYLFVKQYNHAGMEQFPMTVTDGRLPETEDELAIPDTVQKNGDTSYDIGDSITLDIGDRTSEDPDISGPMDQLYSMQVDEDGELEEHLSDTSEQTYEIVGIIKTPTWERPISPGRTVVSYLDEAKLKADDTIDASVVFKKLNKNTIENTEQFASDHHIDSFDFNEGLLRYEGVISNDGMRMVMYSLTAIIMAIIIVGSVSLIYNAFNISVADRSKQLGMLASVGATKQQKRNSVFFEGLLIAVIGIPIGIIAGLGGMATTFTFINKLKLDSALGVTEKLQLAVTPGEIMVAVLVSLLTIFISTYIPARKASRVSAIDAIRQTQDVKLSRKKVKTSKLVQKIFGMEASIGLKNLKRNKRSYQAAVISIVISIVLFLSVTYFTDNLKATTAMTESDINNDITVTLIEDEDETFVESVRDLDDVTGTNVTEEVEEVMANVDKEKADKMYRDDCMPGGDGECSYWVSMHVLGDEDLETYADQAGVDADALQNDAAILIDTYTYIDEGTGKHGVRKSLDAEVGDEISLFSYDWEGDNESDLDDMTIAGLTDKIPLGVDTPGMGALSLIISENTFHEFADGALMDLPHDKQLHVNSDDPMGTQEDIENIETDNHAINNYYQYTQDDKQMILLLSIFTYGFIALITAISIANILNTLSTSISLRTREFAMLKSVGMTPKGFQKMIRYESIFYGFKAILYGLPISIGIMFLMYFSFSEGFDYTFTLPWLSILFAIVAVFLIVGLTMLYASSKVKKKNIIDALKQENI